MSQIQSAWNQNEQRCMKLLGSGLGPGVVAQAVGVSESRISQLMSDPVFAAEVSTLRFQSLNKHNEMDNQYDRMEKKIADALEEQLPLMMRPQELLKAASVINGMKRRGASAPEQITHQNQVVNLLMPKVIIQQFTTNVNNQVIQAGGQTLETIQGSTLLNAAKSKKAEMSKLGLGLHNELPNYTESRELSVSTNTNTNTGSSEVATSGTE